MRKSKSVCNSRLRKLSNEDLPYIYSYYLDGQIKWDEWARRVARMREKRNVYRGFFLGGGGHEGKKGFGRPRLRWADDIKVGLK